jgi:hypothetical protein
MKATLRRVAPALLLLILAPLIAEFLLGDFSVRQLGVLLGLLPQYGGGALLVRETARRRGKGWPTIILLALAYALIEEGLTTQSLFNPSYAGQRLLDYGYIAALGTSLDWTVFVLTIHVVWSVACGITIAEAVAGERWDEPWLRIPGYVITALLYVVGCIFTVAFTIKTFPYVATPAQFAAVVVSTIAAIVLGLRLRSTSSSSPEPRSSPAAWIIASVATVLSSAFQLVVFYGWRVLPAAISLLIMLAIMAVAVALIARWSRRPGWGPGHSLALAIGAIVTYGWLGIVRMLVQGHTALGVPTTSLDVVGQSILLLAVLTVAWLGMHRQGRLG